MISGISSALAGLQNETNRINKIAENVANSSSPSEGGDLGVDLARDFIDLSSAKQGFAADAKVIQVEAGLTKSILDIVA